MRRELTTPPIDDLIDDLLDDTTSGLYPGDHGWVDDPIDEGVKWRLTVDRDDTTFEDGINGVDCYGEVATSYYNDGNYQRPSHFDGKARALSTDHGHNVGGNRWTKGVLWWQPRPDIWGTPKPWGNFEDDYKIVKELYENGWAIALLEKRVTLDCGHEETYSTTLGGIDVWPNNDKHNYWREIVSDLINELDG